MFCLFFFLFCFFNFRRNTPVDLTIPYNILVPTTSLVFRRKNRYQTWLSLKQNASFSLKNTTHSSQHKRTLARHCISSRGTDLCYSEACLKAISRAKKSAMKVKIGQVVHHTVLFLKRLRHLEFHRLRPLVQVSIVCIYY